MTSERERLAERLQSAYIGQQGGMFQHWLAVADECMAWAAERAGANDTHSRGESGGEMSAAIKGAGSGDRPEVGVGPRPPSTPALLAAEREVPALETLRADDAEAKLAHAEQVVEAARNFSDIWKSFTMRATGAGPEALRTNEAASNLNAALAAHDAAAAGQETT